MLKGCRQCRREGMKLLLKGERCLSQKCAVVRRAYAPGQHGQNFRGKMSEYGKQLREKQKAKRIYGIAEAQFSRYVDKANKMSGNNTENLMQLLESRLDNVIYRLGFADSRATARQLVTHGHFTLNKKRASIPSIIVKPSDVVEAKKENEFKDIKLSASITWLEPDKKKLAAKVMHLPTREEIDTQINESLIIEYYSR